MLQEILKFLDPTATRFLEEYVYEDKYLNNFKIYATFGCNRHIVIFLGFFFFSKIISSTRIICTIRVHRVQLLAESKRETSLSPSKNCYAGHRDINMRESLFFTKHLICI
jgi:hypothetical protein